MRVLMISKACVVGAYQKKLEELARFNDVELTVVVPPYWRDERGVLPLERAYTEGYELIVEHMALNGHYHLHFYPGLGRRLRRLRPDIVHIDEEPHDVVTFQAMWLSGQVGARALFFTWQNIYRRYPFPFSWLQGYNFRHAAYAIAGNHEAVEVLQGKGYRGAVKVIPQFGVDPEIFRPKVPGTFKVPGTSRSKGEEELVVGYVGRLVEQKGVEVLLQAAAGLEGRWRLSILGSGPLRPRLEHLAQELDLSARVTFEGPIPSTEVPHYLAALDVLVLPSRTRPDWKEQFGRALIEAMACGVPVIGSDSGEIPHVIGGGGLLFAEDEVHDLRAKMQKLLDDPALRARLSARGRERVLAHYTQARVAAETYQIYRALLDR